MKVWRLQHIEYWHLPTIKRIPKIIHSEKLYHRMSDAIESLPPGIDLDNRIKKNRIESGPTHNKDHSTFLYRLELIKVK